MVNHSIWFLLLVLLALGAQLLLTWLLLTAARRIGARGAARPYVPRRPS